MQSWPLGEKGKTVPGLCAETLTVTAQHVIFSENKQQILKTYKALKNDGCREDLEQLIPGYFATDLGREIHSYM